MMAPAGGRSSSPEPQTRSISSVVNTVNYDEAISSVAEDFDVFRRVYAERGFPADVPHTICHADVCRPDWLV